MLIHLLPEPALVILLNIYKKNEKEKHKMSDLNSKDKIGYRLTV